MRISRGSAARNEGREARKLEARLIKKGGSTYANRHKRDRRPLEDSTEGAPMGTKSGLSYRQTG